MLSSMGILLVSAALGGDASVSPTVFDDYKPAYMAAKSANRPLLVIINPGTESDAKSLDLEDVTRSGHRREILGDYVVAVIDASTPEGQKAHKLFGSPALPRVSVIDKQQKWQIYRTSKSLKPHLPALVPRVQANRPRLRPKSPASQRTVCTSTPGSKCANRRWW